MSATERRVPLPVVARPEVPDLAPEIPRQRLVIEGLVEAPIQEAAIVAYLTELSDVCGMRQLTEPVTHRSDRYGWAVWVHREASGAHFYAWESPRCFFSVDTYTCKIFDADAAVSFTAEILGATSVVAKAW